MGILVLVIYGGNVFIRKGEKQDKAGEEGEAKQELWLRLETSFDLISDAAQSASQR